MVADLVRKLRPRELLDLQHVVQELHELDDAAAHLRDLVGLLARRHVLPHVAHAAVRRRHDVVVARERAREVLLRRLRLRVEAGVDHRLAATRRVDRVLGVDAQAAQQLQGGDPRLRLQCVSVARHEQRDSHMGSLGSRVSSRYGALLTRPARGRSSVARRSVERRRPTPRTGGAAALTGWRPWTPHSWSRPWAASSRS